MPPKRPTQSQSTQTPTPISPAKKGPGRPRKAPKDVSETTIEAQKENHRTNEDEKHLSPVISGERSAESNSATTDEPKKKPRKLQKSDEKPKGKTIKNPGNKTSAEGLGDVIEVSEKRDDMPVMSEKGEKQQEGDVDEEAPALSMAKRDPAKWFRHRIVLVTALVAILLMWVMARTMEDFMKGWDKLKGRFVGEDLWR